MPERVVFRAFDASYDVVLTATQRPASAGLVIATGKGWVSSSNGACAQCRQPLHAGAPSPTQSGPYATAMQQCILASSILPRAHIFLQ